jgi:hypothetical protein
MLANRYRFTPKTIVIAKLVLRYLTAQHNLYCLLSCGARYDNAQMNDAKRHYYSSIIFAYGTAIALYERSHDSSKPAISSEQPK